MQFSNQELKQEVKENESNLVKDGDIFWWQYRLVSEIRKTDSEGKVKITPAEAHFLQCVELAGKLVAVIPPVVKILEQNQVKNWKDSLK